MHRITLILVSWLLASAAGELPAHSQATAPTVVICPAGTYTLTLANPVTITQTADSITFSWGTNPPPPPPPGPTPTGHLWIVPVYEYDQLQSVPPGQQAIRTSTTIQAALTPLDATFREYDKDNAAISAWSSSWSGITLPVLLVICKDASGKGKLVEAISLPADEASLVAAVKKLRGGP